MSLRFALLVVLLPIASSATGAATSAESDGWRAFSTRHPGWTLQWSSDEAGVHRAWGPGVRVSGPITDREHAVTAARLFLSAEDARAKTREADLELRAALKGGHVWYVHFRPRHEGIPILNADVTVRLWEDGRVFAFGYERPDELSLDLRPRLDDSECADYAVAGLDFDATRDRRVASQELAILEVDGTYRLVRRVDVSQWNPRHEWMTYVDVHSGEVVARLDRVRYAGVQGVVSSQVHPAQPSNPLTQLPNAETYVDVGGVDVLTGDLGDYLRQVSGPVDVRFELRGPYGHALRSDQPDTTRVIVAVDADTDPVLDHVWDDGNSHADERDAFFHQQKIHAYVKTLDPGFTGLDWSMPIHVRVPGTCNAYWDGSSINFLRAGGGCNSTAQMDDVVYHEYTHAINDYVYVAAGQPGMTSSILHEGLADITAAFITDDPIMADEFFDDFTPLRSVDNDRRYPEDVVRESHRDGLILAGALWDLRERVGLSVAERLVWFARYGTPDNDYTSPFATAEAFTEFLLEVMIADDDDGDLSNGTPHQGDIVQSFADHGIALSQDIEFNRVRVHDAEDLTVPTTVSVELTTTSANFPDIDPASVQLHYTINTETTEYVVPMTFDGILTYEAAIPSLPPSTVVRYQFEAALEGFASTRIRRHPRAPWWDFVVGLPTELFVDAFGFYENDWRVGDLHDTATDAVWERGSPDQVRIREIPGGFAQPQGDHTKGWTATAPYDRCFVTGAAEIEDEDGVPLYRENEVDGRTTLISPVFDLSQTDRPVIDFWWWFSNNLTAENTYEDPFLVQIRNQPDGRWLTVMETTNPTTDVGQISDAPAGALEFDGWWHHTFRVRDYLEPTAHVQVRFVAEDLAGDTVVEAALDDFRITDYAEVVSATPPSTPPARTRLLDPAPNPFNPRVTLAFDLAGPAPTRLTLVSVAGRVIRTVLDGPLDAGRYEPVWDGRDDRGRTVASGVYYAVLRAGRHYETRKVTLVR